MKEQCNILNNDLPECSSKQDETARSMGICARSDWQLSLRCSISTDEVVEDGPEGAGAAFLIVVRTIFRSQQS